MTARTAPPADIDGRRGVAARIPALTDALDGAAMAPRLAAALGGGGQETCTTGKAMYLGDRCSFRYEVSGTVDGLVLARAFASEELASRDASACERLAASIDAAPPAGGQWWAELPREVVVSWFPIDPTLPQLVTLADPGAMAEVLGAFGLRVEAVDLGHYGRRDRCVLRYSAGTTEVYGKTRADDRGRDVGPALAALEATGVRVPEHLGYVEELRLCLLAALPGRPELPAALRAGSGVETHVADAARAAVAVHAATPTATAARTLDVERAEIEALLALARPVSPEFAGRLDELWTDVAAAADEPLELGFAHGDFTPSQLLHHESGYGLVDFDDVCVAEPALDLGQFVAYLRLAVAKTGGSGALADPLVDGFLAGYAAEAGVAMETLRPRVRLYACISLFRTVLHAWQKLKPARASLAWRLLLEEVAWLAPTRS